MTKEEVLDRIEEIAAEADAKLDGEYDRQLILEKLLDQLQLLVVDATEVAR